MKKASEVFMTKKAERLYGWRATYAPEDGVTEKHLPGQHDQESHGQRGAASLDDDEYTPIQVGESVKYSEITESFGPRWQSFSGEGYRGPNKYRDNSGDKRPNVYGDGKYFAKDEAGARVFTDSPKKETVSIDNPLRITSRAQDETLRSFIQRDTGVKVNYPWPGSRLAERAMTKWISEQGYDGVIIDYKGAPGGSQIIQIDASAIKERISARFTVKHLPGGHDQDRHGDRFAKEPPRLPGELRRATSGQAMARQKERIAIMEQTYPGVRFSQTASNPMGVAEGKKMGVPGVGVPLAIYDKSAPAITDSAVKSIMMQAYQSLPLRSTSPGFGPYVTYNNLKFGSGLSFQEIFGVVKAMYIADPYSVKVTVNRSGDNVAVALALKTAIKESEMNDLILSSWIESLKHQQGGHNQDRHGWRYGRQGQSGDEKLLAVRRSVRDEMSEGERQEYRKRAVERRGMAAGTKRRPSGTFDAPEKMRASVPGKSERAAARQAEQAKRSQNKKKIDRRVKWASEGLSGKVEFDKITRRANGDVVVSVDASKHRRSEWGKKVSDNLPGAFFVQTPAIVNGRMLEIRLGLKEFDGDLIVRVKESIDDAANSWWMNYRLKHMQGDHNQKLHGFRYGKQNMTNDQKLGKVRATLRNNKTDAEVRAEYRSRAFDRKGVQAGSRRNPKGVYDAPKGLTRSVSRQQQRPAKAKKPVVEPTIKIPSRLSKLGESQHWPKLTTVNGKRVEASGVSRVGGTRYGWHMALDKGKQMYSYDKGSTWNASKQEAFKLAGGQTSAGKSYDGPTIVAVKEFAQAAADRWYEAYKHEPGKHDQESHGNRGSEVGSDSRQADANRQNDGRSQPFSPGKNSRDPVDGALNPGTAEYDAHVKQLVEAHNAHIDKMREYYNTASSYPARYASLGRLYDAKGNLRPGMRAEMTRIDREVSANRGFNDPIVFQNAEQAHVWIDEAVGQLSDGKYESNYTGYKRQIANTKIKIDPDAAEIKFPGSQWEKKPVSFNDVISNFSKENAPSDKPGHAESVFSNASDRELKGILEDISAAASGRPSRTPKAGAVKPKSTMSVAKINDHFLSKGVRPDQVSRRADGTFIARQGFYYRHGNSQETWKARIQSNLPPGFKVIDYGEKYTSFNGGSSVANQSHWWVVFGPE